MDNEQSRDVPFKEYIDAQLREVRRAVEIATAASSIEGVPLREYVEAVLDEQKRALDMAAMEREKAASALREQTQRALDKADSEREKAASALRDEQQRALDKADAEREKAASVLREEQSRALVVAASEREKSAHVLREGLTERIAQGDENLRAHIDHQVGQIREALDSAEKLEKARIAAVEEKIAAAQRELKLIQDASETAIQKAEVATERRLEGMNEFRKQLEAQSNTFLPREVAEANFTELRKALSVITERINLSTGAGTAERRGQDRVQPWQLAAVSLAASLFIAVIVFVANLVAS